MVNKEEELRSEWDARQQYVKKLETLNTIADSLRIQIELKRGNAVEMAWYYKAYFSVVRRLYKNIKFHFTDEENEKVEKMFEEVKRKLNVIKADGVKSSVIIPKGVADEIENLQDIVNKKRFDVGLVVPIKKPVRYDPLEGYENI